MGAGGVGLLIHNTSYATALVLCGWLFAGLLHNSYYVNVALGGFLWRIFLFVRVGKLFATAVKRSVTRIAMSLQKRGVQKV